MAVVTTGVASAARLAAVRAAGLLDRGPEEAFNRLTRLGAMFLSTPMVALTVVDDVRSFLKGAPDPAVLCGPSGTYESPIGDAACRLVINSGDVVCAPDVSAHARLRDLPQIHAFGAAAWVGVPVCDPDGNVVGNLCAMDTVVRPWTDSDVEVLRTLAAAAGGEVALRLALRVAEHHAAEALALAETLQQSLIPTAPPRLPGVQIGTRFRPGGTGVEVMGDFYDIVPVGGGFGVVIGDVCGKGVAAARATGMARSAVRTAAHSESDPAVVLCTINEVLREWFGARPSFLTAVYATLAAPRSVVDGADSPASYAWRVAVASGGHPPGYVLRADGRVEQLAGGGRVLGLGADCPIGRETLHLELGDAVMWHTDGITEARRAGDGEQFDESGVLEVLAASARGADADTIAGVLADAAHAFAGGVADDDSGVVVIRVLPS